MTVQRLKRLNNKRYEFYKVYDATNNELSIHPHTTYREAKKLAFEWLKNSGATVEIVGYKNYKCYVIARCEDF